MQRLQNAHYRPKTSGLRTFSGAGSSSASFQSDDSKQRNKILNGNTQKTLLTCVFIVLFFMTLMYFISPPEIFVFITHPGTKHVPFFLFFFFYFVAISRITLVVCMQPPIANTSFHRK